MTQNPLDNKTTNGGYVRIFRKIACIGDSLSSGEFEGTNDEGGKTYHDMFEYSWGQVIARAAGTTVYNFSRGGMSAGVYYNTFADDKGFWNRDLACQAYIMALGVNDATGVINGVLELGSADDIDVNDRKNNKQTFIGWYGAIIQRYREIAPDSFFFLITPPRDGSNEERNKIYDKMTEEFYRIAEMFNNIYILDLRKYAPEYDEEFHHNFFLGGHLNPMGYIYTAEAVMSYIDWIIQNDMKHFSQTAFINTPYKNTIDVEKK